jgi:hypothetical protein
MRSWEGALLEASVVDDWGGGETGEGIPVAKGIWGKNLLSMG